MHEAGILLPKKKENAIECNPNPTTTLLFTPHPANLPHDLNTQPSS